jgi:hypothetical protein
LPFNEAWSKLIEYHSRIKPAAYWKKLLDFDFEVEQQEISQWLEQVVQDEPLPAEVQALWFGLAKFSDGNSKEEFYATYLVGSEKYDKEDIEWATEPVYSPEERYFVSDIYNEIDKVVTATKGAKGDVYSFLDWLLPVAYYSLNLNDIFQNHINNSNFLKHRGQLHIACGHDSGDYLNIGSIKRT